MPPMTRYQRLSMIAALVAGGLIGCGGPVPPSAGAILRDALAAYEQGDDPGATEKAGRFIALHPKAQEAAEAYYLRGLVRFRRGDAADAEQDLLQAIELTRRPDLQGRAHLALARLAERDGDDAAAETNYLAALESLQMREPPSDQVLYGLAVLMQRRGEWLEADRHFDRLIYLFGDGPQASDASGRVRGRAWTVQVGAFTQRSNAERLAARLGGDHADVRVVPLGTAQIRFVVQVGWHGTFAAARRAKAELTGIAPDGFVTTARE